MHGSKPKGEPVQRAFRQTLRGAEIGEKLEHAEAKKDGAERDAQESDAVADQPALQGAVRTIPDCIDGLH